MSDSSREDSPDWLRHFQGPSQEAVALSSDTESPLSDDDDDEDTKNLRDLFHKQVKESSDKENDDCDEESIRIGKTMKDKSLGDTQKDKQARGRKRLREEGNEQEGTTTGEQAVESEALAIPTSGNYSVLSLSSDSDTSLGSRGKSTGIVLSSKFPHSEKVEDVPMEIDEVDTDDGGKSHINEASTVKTTKKQLVKMESKDKKLEKVDKHTNNRNSADLDVEEAAKCRGLHVSSSRVPLVLSEKVSRSKVLVECEGDSIDMSGDVGAVGRVVISDDSSENHELLLDLKGTIYRTSIVPSRTFCVVNFVQSEAKIEAIMNDFIQLEPQSNVYEAETMVEGTLDGFLFDSDGEGDELPKTAAENQNEDAEEQSHGKTKQKAEKASINVRKKVKTAPGKPPKKVKKKSQAPKKKKGKK